MYDQSLMDDMIRKLVLQGLQKKIVMNGDTMIDKGTDEALGPEVDSTYWKDKFQADFIVFTDHEITCCRVGELRILNGIGTLGT